MRNRRPTTKCQQAMGMPHKRCPHPLWCNNSILVGRQPNHSRRMRLQSESIQFHQGEVFYSVSTCSAFSSTRFSLREYVNASTSFPPPRWLIVGFGCFHGAFRKPARPLHSLHLAPSFLSAEQKDQRPFPSRTRIFQITFNQASSAPGRGGAGWQKTLTSLEGTWSA